MAALLSRSGKASYSYSSLTVGASTGLAVGDGDILMVTGLHLDSAGTPTITVPSGFELDASSGYNTVNGWLKLDGSGTAPDSTIPASIARDSEVSAAVSAHAGSAATTPGSGGGGGGRNAAGGAGAAGVVIIRYPI
jgi:hypothetical protein